MGLGFRVVYTAIVLGFMVTSLLLKSLREAIRGFGSSFRASHLRPSPLGICFAVLFYKESQHHVSSCMTCAGWQVGGRM